MGRSLRREGLVLASPCDVASRADRVEAGCGASGAYGGFEGPGSRNSTSENAMLRGRLQRVETIEIQKASELLGT